MKSSNSQHVAGTAFTSLLHAGWADSGSKFSKCGKLLSTDDSVWLLQISAELVRPVQDPETLVAAGKWMPASELVQMLTKAQAQSQAEWQQPSQSVVDAARGVHDSVLSAAVITHLPPSRISCLRSMLGPDSPAGCTHPDCKHADCQGNRLYIVSTAPLKLRMKFPHHKNARRWKRAVIEFDVPHELAEMLLLYLEGPRQTLLQYQLLAEEPCVTVFMDKHCRPFTSSTFCLYWQNWMRSQGGPPLSPSICRQIFVTERRSDGAAPGPCDRGAAMVMGHSTRQWNDWYDIKFHAKLAQHAVDAMQTWRAAMLQGHDAAARTATASNPDMTGAATAQNAQDAQANAAIIDAAITAAASSHDEATSAGMPAAKRGRIEMCSDSDIESCSQPEPAMQHAAQLGQVTETGTTQAAQSAQQAELESDTSEFMSCNSGSDSEIEVELDLV